MKLIPRYYQQDGFDAWMDYVSHNHGKNPLIVLPTGSGKSFLQSSMVQTVLSANNKTRVLLVTHQKKLLQQNAITLLNNFNKDEFIDYGFYSAGLKRKETEHRIIFAGIQSCHAKAYELGWFDLILIDEAHLVNQEESGTYRKFLKDMKKINPKVVITGLTATKFRMKTGLLTEGKNALFDDVCYEVGIKELIEANHPKNKDNKQYLCSLISKGGENKADISNVHTRAGEYVQSELEEAFTTGDIVTKAVIETIGKTTNRNKILVFTTGVKHATEVFEKFQELNQAVGVIHSKLTNDENEKTLNDFNLGKIKYLINAKILTTGYDEPAIDCIALFMSTKSPGLLLQIIGRALRLHESKKDALILDFGKNLEFHGPIDQIEIKSNKKTGKSEVSSVPQKECPKCQSLLHLSVMECPDCGYLFPVSEKHEETASEEDIISVWKKPKTIEIEKVEYYRHTKRGGQDSLRVDYYYTMFEKYSSWICIEHQGFAKKKAFEWLRQVTNLEVNSIEDALKNCDNFRLPSTITVDTNSKYPSITGYFYETEIKSIDIQHNIIDATIINEEIDYDDLPF